MDQRGMKVWERWMQRFRAWAKPDVPVLPGPEAKGLRMLVEEVDGGWLIGKRNFVPELWPGAEFTDHPAPTGFRYIRVPEQASWTSLSGYRRVAPVEGYSEFRWLRWQRRESE